jgi:hypothetical protein
VTPTVDRDQLAALRLLRQQLGHVQVLTVERRGVEGGGGEPPPSLASQQLALTIEAPLAHADPPVNRQCPAPRYGAGPHDEPIAG